MVAGCGVQVKLAPVTSITESGLRFRNHIGCPPRHQNLGLVPFPNAGWAFPGPPLKRPIERALVVVT